MCSLSNGAQPEIGKITIAEKNAELFHEKDQITKGRKGTRAKFPDYRRYDLTGAALKSPQSLAQESKISAFIPPDDGIVEKLFATWELSGFTTALREVVESPSGDAKIAQICNKLKVIATIEQAKARLFSQKQLSCQDLIKRSCLVPDWPENVIKAFCVHPQIQGFAVAYKDDTVKIFSTNRFNDFEPVMKDKKQKDVACVAFRPLSAAHLAAGCKDGILLWLLDPSTSGVRPGANLHRFLTQPGHSPVTSLSWSQTGRLLASGSPLDSAVVIWDVLLQRSTPLRRVGPPITYLSWSPCETRLYSSTTQDMFRIWETKTWTCEKWSNLAGSCQAACWSPCGRYLIFTVEEEPSLYYLYFSSAKDDCKNDSSSNGLAVKCFDFTEYTWNNELDDTIISAGGTVQSLAWDPTGSRIAVIFKDNEKTHDVQSHVAILRTVLDPVFEVSACGFVSGTGNEKPLSVSFLASYDKGALLLVCWSSGMVSQIPMLFLSPSLQYQDVLTVSQREATDELETLHSVEN